MNKVLKNIKAYEKPTKDLPNFIEFYEKEKH